MIYMTRLMTNQPLVQTVYVAMLLSMYSVARWTQLVLDLLMTVAIAVQVVSIIA